MSTTTTLDVQPNLLEMAQTETISATFTMSNLLAAGENVLTSTAKMVSASNGIVVATPGTVVTSPSVAVSLVGSNLSVGSNYHLLVTFQTSAGNIYTVNLNINCIF